MKVVFSHELEDAWFFPILSVAVYDTAADNVVCRDKEGEKKYTVSEASINEIRGVIKNNPNMMSLEGKDIEFPFVMDGTISVFTFSDGESENKVSAFNIWAFRKDDYWHKNSPSPAVNAKAVISVFDAVSKILINDGVDKRFLKLG